MEQKRELCLSLVFCLVFFGILFVLLATIGEEGVGLVVGACVVAWGLFALFMSRERKPKKIKLLRKGRCPSCGETSTIVTKRTGGSSTSLQEVEVRCNACGWEYSSSALCPQCHSYSVKFGVFITSDENYQPYWYRCKKCGWEDMTGDPSIPYTL